MSALVQTAASVVPSATAKYLFPGRVILAGAAIQAGQPFYIDSAGVAQLTDSNAASPANTVDAIAANSAGIGQPVMGVMEDSDFTHGCAGVVAGDPIFTHPTAGSLGLFGELAAGHYTALVMIAKSATKGVLKIVQGGVAHA